MELEKLDLEYAGWAATEREEYWKTIGEVAKREVAKTQLASSYSAAHIAQVAKSAIERDPTQEELINEIKARTFETLEDVRQILQDLEKIKTNWDLIN